VFRWAARVWDEKQNYKKLKTKDKKLNNEK
jgi:hypothetical protein